MTYEIINSGFVELNELLKPLLLDFNNYFNSKNGKIEIINTILNKNDTDLLKNMNQFFDYNTMNNFFNKLYDFFLRNNKEINIRLKFYENILPLQLNNKKLYNIVSYKNIFSMLFTHKNMNSFYVDLLANIVNQNYSSLPLIQLVYDFGSELTTKSKSSNMDVIDIHFNDGEYIKKILMYTLFLLKLYNKNTDDIQLYNLLKRVMDYGYFNYICELDIRKGELFMTTELYNMYKDNRYDESLWKRISSLKHKKNLLEKRLQILNNYNYILYEVAFDKFIYNESNNYYYEYLCYLYFKRNFIMLGKRDINNLLEIGLNNEIFINDDVRNKYLSTIEYFALNKKEYFNYNQEYLLESFKNNNEDWFNIMFELLEYEYNYCENIYDYKFIDVIELVLTDYSPYCKYTLDKFIHITLNLYLKSSTFIEKDKIINLLNYIQEENVYLSRLNFLTFIDFIEKYSYDEESDIDINFLQNKIVNIINNNNELFIKYIRGGYIDKSLINPNSQIHEAINNLKYESKELEYNPDHLDVISSLPIISFVCMPHNDKIFAEKYTIYRWLEFNSTNPYTNEELDSIELEKFNDTKDIKEICEDFHRKLFEK